MSQIKDQPQSDAKPFLIAGLALGGVVVLLTIAGAVIALTGNAFDYNSY